MKNFIKLFFIIFLLIIIIVLSYNYIFLKFTNKHNLEMNSIHFFEKSSNFTINKIILYTNAYGVNKNTNFQQSNWILDLYQYTDIAIFIDNGTDDLNSSNTIKKIYIEDINFYNSPKSGTTSLYYLDSGYFGTETYSEDYKIDNTLEFTILNDSNENDSIQTNTPVMFSDLSNPITLKYVNNNIYNNFNLPTNEAISFDGSLLNKSGISISSLESSFSFYIVIVNNNNETFKHLVHIDIPLSNTSGDIYSGFVLETKNNLNYSFLKE